MNCTDCTEYVDPRDQLLDPNRKIEEISPQEFGRRLWDGMDYHSCLEQTSKGWIPYHYLDDDYEMVLEVLRTPEKDFLTKRPARPEETQAGHALDPKTGEAIKKNGKGELYEVKKGYIWTERGLVGEIPLFRENLLPEAKEVWVVGGEKDANTGRRLGLAAVSQKGGENRWEKRHSPKFKGKHVYIVPDNDEVGREFAQSVAVSVFEHAESVKIIDLGHSQPKADLTDWVEGFKLGNSLDRKKEDTEFIRSKVEEIVEKTPMLTEDDIKRTKKELDRRKKTSPRNGKKGGRPPVSTEIADSFMAEHMDSSGALKIFHHRGQWQEYVTDHYEMASQDDIKSQVMGFLRQKFPANATPNMVKTLLEQIKADDTGGGIPSKMDLPVRRVEKGVYQEESGARVMKNGIIDIGTLDDSSKSQTISIKPHTPDLLTNLYFPYVFDPSATCPRFLKYLEGVQPCEKARDMIKKMMGLLLTSDTSFNVAFMLVGQGGCGKSVLMHLVAKLVGEGNVCCLPIANMLDRFQSHVLTTHLVNLIGDLPLLDSKNCSMSRLEGFFKDVCDGAIIQIEHKQHDTEKGRVTARNLIAMNSLPRFTDKSNGVWDRLRIIPFDEIFRGTDNENRHLRTELEEELPGILNLALEGLRSLNGIRTFPEHPKGDEMKKRHRESCDYERTFLQDNYICKDGCSEPVTTVFEKYSQWCTENCYRTKSKSNLAQAIEMLYSGKVHRKRDSTLGGTTVWRNLTRLNPY